MKYILKPLVKSVSISLGLTVAASATDAAIHKKMFESGNRPSYLVLRFLGLSSCTTALIISNKEMYDTMKIVKFLKEFGLLIKAVSETIKYEAKEQKGGFFSILLGSLLGYLLAGKGTIRAGEGQDF